MEDINVFVFSKLKLMNERPSKVKSWIIIIGILFVMFLIASMFIRIKIYSKNVGYVDDNIIRIVLNKDSFPINKNNKLYIGNKQYKYKVLKIESSNGYYELLIDCKIDKKLHIKNNIITVRFKKGEKTLWKIIVEKLKKGLV